MERLSYELIQAVRQDQTVTVRVIAHEGSRALAPLFALTAVPRVLRAASEADVVHLGDPLLSLIGWAVKRWRRVPVAVTVHGLDVAWQNWLYQMYLQLFFKNFDLYLPISRYAADLLTGFGVRGRIEVANPGIADRMYDPHARREQLGELLGHDVSNAHVLLTTGRLVKRKGHAWFVQTVLPKLSADVVYVIAGAGPEQNRIAATADAAGVADRVILLGRVDDATLKLLYSTADAFVQPNIPIEGDAEGFGLVLLEAALCELPVFAARVDGIPDAVKSGENGTLLPAEDAGVWVQRLTMFLQAPQRDPKARAYTLAHYGWPAQAAHVVRLLQSLRDNH